MGMERRRDSNPATKEKKNGTKKGFVMISCMHFLNDTGICKHIIFRVFFFFTFFDLSLNIFIVSFTQNLIS